MGDDGHPWYEPPEFGVYEYDDAYAESGAQLRPDDGAGRRWLLGHQGQVGHPAEEVHLAWGNGEVVAVAWTGRRHSSAPHMDARITAAMMAVDGPIAWCTHHGPPRGTSRDVLRYAETADLWHPRELTIDGTARPGFGAEIGQVRVGYALLDDELIVGVAGTNLATPARDVPLALRVLANPAPYALDPFRPHRTVDHAAEWGRFLGFHAISQVDDA